MYLSIVHEHVCERMRECARDVHMHECVYECMRECAYVRMHEHVSERMRECVHVRMHKCVCMYTCSQRTSGRSRLSPSSMWV